MYAFVIFFIMQTKK